MGAASFLHVFALLVTLEMTIHKCLQAHLNFIVDTPHPTRARCVSWKWENAVSCKWGLRVVEGSFEVKLPTIWTNEKQRREESEKRREEERRSKRESLRRKKIQVREKVGKSRNTVCFQWFEAPEGRRVGLLKRRVRSQLARWEMKNCMPLWREAHFQVKMYKAHQVRTTFGSCDVEKLHAVLARNTFRSQNAQNTSGSDHFRKLDVEKVHAVVARSTFRSQNVQNTSGSDHFWKLRCWKSARRCGAKQKLKLKCEKHHMPGPLWDIQMSFRVAGAWDCGPCQKWAKREGFVAFPKTMAGVGHLKRICKDAFSDFPWQAQYKRHVHQSC